MLSCAVFNPNRYGMGCRSPMVASVMFAIIMIHRPHIHLWGGTEGHLLNFGASKTCTAKLHLGKKVARILIYGIVYLLLSNSIDIFSYSNFT